MVSGVAFIAANLSRRGYGLAMATDQASPPLDQQAFRTPEVDVAALTALLDGRYPEVRELVRANLVEHAQILEDAEEMSRADFRERVKDVVVQMASTGQTGMGFPEEYGGGGDIGASLAAFETLAFGDLSVLVKVGVQFGLFGGAILQLGTKTHHDLYLADLISGRTMGCFAMTETGHGSNVQALGTVARYDAETEEFVITTPDDASRKDYIGNAAAHAELAAVFAQLEVDGESHGVHAFVVQIRRDGAVVDGVRIEDCGDKMGLDGVDNGRIWFDGVRVPRDGAAQPVRRGDPRGALPLSRSTTPTGASSRCSAPSCRAGSASAAPASTRPRSR